MYELRETATECREIADIDTRGVGRNRQDTFEEHEDELLDQIRDAKLAISDYLED